VIAAVQKSPTLSAQIAALEQRKFTIVTGPVAGSGKTDSARHTITIGQPESVAQTVADIAHESGHATFGVEPFPAGMEFTRDNFVQNGIQRSLRDEGRAQFNAPP